MGLALVAMAEDLGRDMAYRSLEHLLQYGEPHVRRAHVEGHTVAGTGRKMLRRSCHAQIQARAGVSCSKAASLENERLLA
jgi:hypothetical protein